MDADHSNNWQSMAELLPCGWNVGFWHGAVQKTVVESFFFKELLYIFQNFASLVHCAQDECYIFLVYKIHNVLN